MVIRSSSPIAQLADSLFGRTVRAMWDHVITRLTIGLNVESVMWTLGPRPPTVFKIALWERLLPASAVDLIGELRSAGFLDGVLALQGEGVVTPHVDPMQRTAQLRWMITDGRLVAWRGLPALVVPEAPEKPGEVSYSYTKPKMTPQTLLTDEAQLKKISGVRQVTTKLEHQTTGRVNVIFDSANKAPGIQYLLAQGYVQGRAPISNDVLAPLFRKHAEQLGMDAGTQVAAPAATEGAKPVVPTAAAVPPPSAGQPLGNTVSDSCPSHNHRSESHQTAAPEVMEWLRETGKVLTPRKQDEILGAVSGGGFLVSTTRVSELPEGTSLFRYYDAAGGAGNVGGWWTTQLVAGDPRQTLALPPSEPTWSNSATSLCHAQLGFGITALTGLGAPRCSNKPGGPQQWFISWQDREAMVLRLPDDISQPLPKEP